MDRSNAFHTSRRDFAATVVSGCALCCLGPQRLLAASQGGQESSAQQGKHKFDEQTKVTHRRLAQIRYDSFIKILKQMEKDIGKEKLLAMVKKASHAALLQLGKRVSGQITSLEAFARYFKDDNSDLSKTLVHDIVEDNERVLEVRVTECLAHVVFNDADALDLGYACVCHSDFGLPIGIHPKFKLIRTKTLMQGHDCCNHRYVWEQ